MDMHELLDLCLRYHEQGLKLSRNQGSAAGNQPRDFYAMMAAHLRLEQYQMSCKYAVLEIVHWKLRLKAAMGCWLENGRLELN